MKMNRLRQQQCKAEIGISSGKEITGWVQEGISQGSRCFGGGVFMVVMLTSCGVRIPDGAEWVHRSEQDRWKRAPCPWVRKEFLENEIDFDTP